MLWQYLFLACLPAAILLGLSGRWGAGLVVFLVGTPLFWFLRNRSVSTAASTDPVVAELRGEPNRFDIPPKLAARLSSRDLSDVPEPVRIGSPHDASDASVKETLRKVGVLHPGTNYAVVYRCCFGPFLDEGESAEFLRFGWGSLGVTRTGNTPRMDDAEQAWVLVTDRGVYWHQVSDLPPGMPARDPMEALGHPRRSFHFGPGVSASRHPRVDGPGGIPLSGFTVEAIEDRSVWQARLLLPDDPLTETIVRFVDARSASK